MKDAPGLDGLFHPPLSIGGRAKAGLTDRNPGNRQAEASPPGPPLIVKSERTKGVTNKNGRNAAGIRLDSSSCQTRSPLFRQRREYGWGRVVGSRGLLLTLNGLPSFRKPYGRFGGQAAIFRRTLCHGLGALDAVIYTMRVCEHPYGVEVRR